ncbi:MAG: hypothetical protein H6739_17975 [Alphaproteobacteria bacterium]|nr:hypothetical protein [Alphaproteobacteria bacterium]
MSDRSATAKKTNPPLPTLLDGLEEVLALNSPRDPSLIEALYLAWAQIDEEAGPEDAAIGLMDVLNSHPGVAWAEVDEGILLEHILDVDEALSELVMADRETTWFGVPGAGAEALARAAAALGLELSEDPEAPGRAVTQVGTWFALEGAWSSLPLFLRSFAEQAGGEVQVVQARAWALVGEDPAVARLELRADRLDLGGGQRRLPVSEAAARPRVLTDGPLHRAEDVKAALRPALTEAALTAAASLGAVDGVHARFVLIDPSAEPEEAPAPEPEAAPPPEPEPEPALPEPTMSSAQLVTEAGASALDVVALAWLTERMAVAGRLDREMPLPDLDRWTQRLLRRFGGSAPPAPGSAEFDDWQAQWERLTRKERAQTSPSPRLVPAFKLELEGTWGLTTQEIEVLLGRMDERAPAAIEDTVAALRSALEAVGAGAELRLSR